MMNRWIKVSWIALLFLLTMPVMAQHGDGEMMPMLPQVGPSVTIRFEALVGDKPASCGMVYESIGTEASTISLLDFRFYVSNLRLITADGDEVPVELTPDGLWQYEGVALLDFEDATSGCAEGGTPEINDKIVGSVPEGDYTGVIFDLGIPFELNHLDAAAAPAPLNIPAMWWQWQYGYKYARIDLSTPNGALPAWFIHLGSTGCEAADFTTPPEAPCNNPNITTIRLDNFNPVQNFVVADLTSLVDDVNLDENSPEPPGCMSGIDDPDCGTLFPGFGLELSSGLVSEESTQAFFRVQ